MFNTRDRLSQVCGSYIMPQSEYLLMFITMQGVDQMDFWSDPVKKNVGIQKFLC